MVCTPPKCFKNTTAVLINTSIDGEWINFVAPNMTVAEKMMETEFGIYKNNGVTRIRTLHYSIPENLRGYVLAILERNAYHIIHPTDHSTDSWT